MTLNLDEEAIAISDQALACRYPWNLGPLTNLRLDDFQYTPKTWQEKPTVHKLWNRYHNKTLLIDNLTEVWNIKNLKD